MYIFFTCVFVRAPLTNSHKGRTLDFSKFLICSPLHRKRSSTLIFADGALWEDSNSNVVMGNMQSCWHMHNIYKTTHQESILFSPEISIWSQISACVYAIITRSKRTSLMMVFRFKVLLMECHESVSEAIKMGLQPFMEDLQTSP